MSRQLREGDRVSATGTVLGISGDNHAMIEMPTGDLLACPSDALTLLTPAEPPMGAVVVKDDVAWILLSDGWCTYGFAGRTPWSELADGDVIHVPGGGA
jgi:hypothetical protein